MIRGSLALAFSAGMVATVNPCGFAMLPAYLSYFLGIDQTAGSSSWRNVGRALAVGGTLTAGFIAVFGVFGIIHERFTSSLLEYTSYVTIMIGVALVLLGVAMLRGFELTVKLPKLSKGMGGRELSSMFLFGVSYAIASLGCTIGTFLVVVAPTFREENFLSGVAAFVLYGLGMGAVVIFLTVATALAKTSMVKRLRQMMKYVNRVSGVLLVATGLYLGYYGWYEIRVNDGDLDRSPIVDWFQARQRSVQGWIDDFGPVRLGLICAVFVVGSALLTYLLRRPVSPESALPDRTMPDPPPTTSEAPRAAGGASPRGC